MESITVKYKLRDYLRMIRLQRRRSLFPKVMKVGLCIESFFFLQKIIDGDGTIFGYFICIFTLIYVTDIYLPFYARYLFNHRSPLLHENVEINFYPDRVIVKSIGSKAVQSWFEKTIVVRDVIILKIDSKSLLFVLKSHTQSDEQFSRIAELVQQIPQGKDQLPQVNHQ